MTTNERSAELARGWIEAWKRMDMEWLREHLAPGFVHVSPFGRLEGRDSYLATVEPMARKSVMELSIREVIASGNRAAVKMVRKGGRRAVGEWWNDVCRTPGNRHPPALEFSLRNLP